MKANSIARDPGTSPASIPALPKRRQHQALRRAACETLEERRLFSFSPVVAYPVTGNPATVVTADLNGDGRLDIATANFNDSTVSVLLGNADGTFQAAVTSPTGVNPRTLAVGNFNADGRPDLVTANVRGLSVLLNTGTGAFAAPASLSIPDAPLSVAVGDFNADGKLDLVATSKSERPGFWNWYYYYPAYDVSSATVLLGNGTGSFTTAGSTAIGQSYYTQGSYSAIAVADFDGDGKHDLAAGAPDSYSDYVLFGTTTGVLTGPTYVAGGNSQSITAGDVNSDGKADLAMTSLYGGVVNLALGNGTGGFGAVQSYATGTNPTSAAIGDFNADGKADLVTANQGDGSVSVLLGQGAGVFQPPVTLATSPAAISAAVGDFNGDGRSDVVAANGSANTVSALLNDGIWPALNAPRITIGDVTVTEGNTGTVSANFTIGLSSSYTQPVTVKYATADGTATVVGGDYQAGL
jgi:hypothetical protein